MEKIIRKLLYWLFKNRIRKFSGVMMLSEEILQFKGEEYKDYAKQDMIRNISATIFREGLITFKEEKNAVGSATAIKAEIYVLKI